MALVVYAEPSGRTRRIADERDSGAPSLGCDPVSQKCYTISRSCHPVMRHREQAAPPTVVPLGSGRSFLPRCEAIIQADDRHHSGAWSASLSGAGNDRFRADADLDARVPVRVVVRIGVGERTRVGDAGVPGLDVGLPDDAAAVVVVLDIHEVFAGDVAESRNVPHLVPCDVRGHFHTAAATPAHVEPNPPVVATNRSSRADVFRRTVKGHPHEPVLLGPVLGSLLDRRLVMAVRPVRKGGGEFPPEHVQDLWLDKPPGILHRAHVEGRAARPVVELCELFRVFVAVARQLSIEAKIERRPVGNHVDNERRGPGVGKVSVSGDHSVGRDRNGNRAGQCRGASELNRPFASVVTDKSPAATTALAKG